MLEISFAVVAILLITAFAGGVLYLAAAFRSTRDAVAVDPATRKALSDRVGALEEDVAGLKVASESQMKSHRSLRGSHGALVKKVNDALNGEYSPDDESILPNADAPPLDRPHLESYFDLAARQQQLNRGGR